MEGRIEKSDFLTRRVLFQASINTKQGLPLPILIKMCALDSILYKRVNDLLAFYQSYRLESREAGPGIAKDCPPSLPFHLALPSGVGGEVNSAHKMNERA